MLNLWIKLGRTDILTLLSLLIHEHGVLLHLFSSLISFIRVLYYSSCTFYTHFARVIPKCLILGGDNVNGIVFLLAFPCFISNIEHLFYVHVTHLKCLLQKKCPFFHVAFPYPFTQHLKWRKDWMLLLYSRTVVEQELDIAAL